MKQVVQAINGGPVRVVDVPRPTIGPTEVLVRTQATLISAGTERAVTALAQSSLLAKAKARPDLVRQVVKKARTEGLKATASAVRARLDSDMPLGYSGCGVAIEVGEHVAHVRPGQLVATGGAGKANHAEYQAVPGVLCVPVPEGVTAEDAAFATVASVALHGLRLADVEVGAKVAIVGLGLLGQLAGRMAMAAGLDVFGIDVDGDAVERLIKAGGSGAVERGDETTDELRRWSRGRGADAVVITAASSSSAIIGRAPTLCRDGATVVVVGDVGLELDRRPFYERELSLRFSRSYGPGRYERSYEDWGVDYPVEQVRWTEGRNLEAVLDLLASGRLAVRDLVTHRFPIAGATAAYELIETRSEPYIGIELTYDDDLTGAAAAEAPITVGAVKVSDSPGVGLIGAGAFARGVLLPALQSAGFDRLVSVASASGLSARHLAERSGFARAVSGAQAVIGDDEVDLVVIATPHDSHAALVVQTLEAGKHVFCEKPLALSHDELDAVEAALAAAPGSVLMVGFNRRWSKPMDMVRARFAGGGPLAITYRINAGALPADHWYNDRRQGGRLLGEVCHFVDTCAAIVGHAATSVSAVGSGGVEAALAQDVGLLLGYPDGSVATILYASGGHSSMEKERIEVLGRGHAAVVDNFASVTVDGDRTAIRPADKGHAAEAVALREAIRGTRQLGGYAIESMRTTLDAVGELLRSRDG